MRRRRSIVNRLPVLCHLNIPRYVDTFEEEPLIGIDEAKRTIAYIEEEQAAVQAQMKKYMEELGL